MKYVLSLAFVLALVAANAQTKLEQDRNAIKAMTGCYQVRFNFAETFAPDTNYQFHDNYTAGALEWVELVEESADKIVLQHLLIVSDSMIVKHWRQDWLYENRDFYTYHMNNHWNYAKKPAKDVAGQWTQKVFQVDDGPRYEGSATWVHVDGRSFWESTTDSPLPRREFSKRSDYNVLERTNHVEIIDKGWIHEQDNAKIIRAENQADVLLAQEKGMNTYYKVDDNQCKPAQDWWARNHPYWKVVRDVWADHFGKKKALALNMKVDNKILFMRLFELGDKYAGQTQLNEAEVRKEVEAVLQKHQG